MITDQFGKRYACPRDFKPRRVLETIELYAEESDRYVGQLTHWEGAGWTHSYRRFGCPALPTATEAVCDFIETAARLKEPVGSWVRMGRPR
jgi:hypothetical protein